MGGFNFISIEDIDSDWVVHGVHVCWITTDGNILLWLWLKLQHQQLQKVKRGVGGHNLLQQKHNNMDDKHFGWVGLVACVLFQCH